MKVLTYPHPVCLLNFFIPLSGVQLPYYLNWKHKMILCQFWSFFFTIPVQNVSRRATLISLNPILTGVVLASSPRLSPIITRWKETWIKYGFIHESKVLTDHLNFFQSRQKSKFINEIRPNRLETVREHVISGINMKNWYKIVRVLYAKISFVQNIPLRNFVLQIGGVLELF